MNDFEKHFEKLAKTDDASTLWINWLDWVIDQNLIINHDRKLNFKVKPHIINGECRRNYIAEKEGVAPQTITNRMKQVFGQETNWQTYVLKVQNGEY